MHKKICYSIKSFSQIDELVRLKKNKKKILVIFIKNYLIKGFGIDWLVSLIRLIKKKFPKDNIKFYIDAGNDYGLSILILRENIDYLKIRSNKVILYKIDQIAKKNNVLLNPSFNVIDV